MPPVVTALIAVFTLVHVVRVNILSQSEDFEFLLYFAFIPARYDPSLLRGGVVPGGVAADIWSFVTYSFIHGDWMHLIVNCIWFLPFGSAVARRFGTVRFLAFFALTSAAGAALHLATHVGALVPMIGASAAISGAMAAAMRFVFQAGGPLGVFRHGESKAYFVPAISLVAAFRDPRILAFLGVWFAVNLLTGLGSLPIAGGPQVVAWEAHIGGFLAGLLAFAVFDPVRPSTGGQDGSDILHRKLNS